MPHNDRSERELFKSALQRTKECPPVEALQGALDGSNPNIAAHAESCAFCATELEMLKVFHAAEVPEGDARAVQLITERLRADAAPVRPRRVVEEREPWWRPLFGGSLFGGSWLRPAALATAGALVILAIGLQWQRNTPPSIDGGRGTGSEVARSQALAILAPLGDLQEAPGEVRWEAVPSAAKYEVRLLEVDHSAFWNAETGQTSIAIPAAVRARIVPAKTLLCQVTALDAAGRKVAESEVVRFRSLQNLYRR